jgi:hypothetical protein
MGHCTFVIRGPGIMAVRCDRGKIHSHCGVVGCQELAAMECDFKIHPRGSAATNCGMKLCDTHAMPFKGTMLCPPHLRFAGRIGRG